MTDERKYAFRWELLGDLEKGRPNLGKFTRLEIYRLMQFTLRDVLERRYGAETTDEIFYQAGYMAGQAFYQHLVGEVTSLEAFVRVLQEALREMAVGILRVEKADLEEGELVITCAEDVDCSGLPELDYEICVYDEGFFAALIESFTGKPFKVKEIDCWCTGDRTCRFRAKALA